MSDHCSRMWAWRIAASVLADQVLSPSRPEVSTFQMRVTLFAPSAMAATLLRGLVHVGQSTCLGLVWTMFVCGIPKSISILRRQYIWSDSRANGLLTARTGGRSWKPGLR